MIRQTTGLFFLFMATCQSLAADDGLIAHWPLQGDSRDVSGNGLHAEAHHVRYVDSERGGRRIQAAEFDGQSSRLEIATNEQLRLGQSDFSISMWVKANAASDDVPGDLLSQYDRQNRRGFHVGLKTNLAVTFSESNTRQLQFAIDQDRPQPNWIDRGRPGNAVLAFALCVYDGNLYAGTCEPAEGDSGHVYRYAGRDSVGGQAWIDCGAPDGSNAVTSLTVFQGQLYAGTGKYRLRGSALTESPNTTLGGHVYRYAGGSKWVDCGRLGEFEAVGGLVVFRNRLYASSLYRPAGFYRYDGDQKWTDCGSPPRPTDRPGETKFMRTAAMGAFNGWLYATCYDGGRVFRFDGKKWFDCGQLGENTQTYAIAVRAGRLYVGTWPSGRVYRFEKPFEWTDVGRLGEELEVMGMLVHNGRLIAGTLPLAEVYQFDDEAAWKRLTRLDHTPDVKYRRAWTMAEFDGETFCSTLPSGKIFSWRAGRVAMTDRVFPAGWHHVAAVRKGRSLKLFIDGQLAGSETGVEPSQYDLSTNQPTWIGFGPNDYFKGQIADVRIYNRSLTPAELKAHSQN